MHAVVSSVVLYELSGGTTECGWKQAIYTTGVAYRLGKKIRMQYLKKGTTRKASIEPYLLWGML